MSNRRQWLENNRSGLAVAGFTILAALLRFSLVGSKTVWLDEAFSIWLARQPLWEMWSWLVRIDQHPPLYYTLLHSWIGLFGDLQGAVRGLSALSSTLAVPIFYAGVCRLTDRPTALIAAFILAISPFHIRYAQEARMYGLLTLAVAAALYYVAVILDERAAPRRVWWGLAISQAAVMLTHNTAAVYFPVALNLAVLLIFFNAKAQRGKDTDFYETTDSIRVDPLNPRHPRAILRSGFGRRWLLFQGVALLLWSPWAWPFVVQSIGVDRQFWLLPPDAGAVWDAFRNFNFAFLPEYLPFQAGWMALYTGLALLGFWRLRRSSAARLLGSLLIVPIAIALLVSLRRPIFYDRTLIWSTLPYYALIAAGIRAIGEGMGRKNEGTQISPITQITQRQKVVQNLRNPRPKITILIQMIFLTVVFFLSSLSLNGYYFWFEKEGWDKAAAYVAENVQPDDLIVFNATWAQIPFEYYYRHYGLDTELRGLPVDLFDRGVLEPLMEPSDIPYLHQLVDDRPRLWLVYSHGWYTDAQQIIPLEIGRALQETSRKHFVGLELVRYEAR
ncbi:MAG: glycosyltransferase family 39 protein [Caldilineaceae bacterium]|nr:glycosyltransferase family 39 protein [Caldilineaceae bacterium]